MNENTEREICPGCPNRCTADALQCGKGRRYFERDGGFEQDGGSAEPAGSRESRERWERGAWGGHGENGERPEHGEHARRAWGGEDAEFGRREHGRPEHGSRPRWGERPEDVDRGESADRPGNGDRPGHAGGPGRGDRPEYAGGPGHGDRSEHAGGPGHGDRPERTGCGNHRERAAGWDWESLTLEEKLAMQFRACAHYFRYGMGQKSGQQRILSMLSERGGLTQRELQSMLGVQPGSLSEILSKVEAGGYIRRRQNERDRRQINLELTEDGKAAAQNFREDHRQMMNDMFSALSEEEKQQLSQLLGKMMENWPRPDEAGPHGPEGRAGFGPRGGRRGRGGFGPRGGERPEGGPEGRRGGPRGGWGEPVGPGIHPGFGGPRGAERPGRQPGFGGLSESEGGPEMGPRHGRRNEAERSGNRHGFGGRMWPEPGHEMSADGDEEKIREHDGETDLVNEAEASRDQKAGMSRDSGDEGRRAPESGLETKTAAETSPDLGAGEKTERAED